MLSIHLQRPFGACQWRSNTKPAKESAMPTYMDMHDLPGVKAADVAGAHEADLRVQGQYGVNYKHYWVDEEAGKVFCLVDAPDRESAARVHREAHGLEAHTLYEVEEGA
jgi:hypothetical protein